MIIDATGLAKTIQETYPGYGLNDLTDLVLEEVATFRGSASWDRPING